MYKKRLSEKIARVFEIVGYIQLVPAILLVILSAIIIFPLLISVPLFGTGLTLFIGYIKHSRGTLGKSKIMPLWIATFLFNFLPLLFPATQYYYGEFAKYESLGLFAVLSISWWIIACCLSLTALYDEFVEGKSKFK